MPKITSSQVKVGGVDCPQWLMFGIMETDYPLAGYVTKDTLNIIPITFLLVSGRVK